MERPAFLAAFGAAWQAAEAGTPLGDLCVLCWLRHIEVCGLDGALPWGLIWNSAARTDFIHSVSVVQDRPFRVLLHCRFHAVRSSFGGVGLFRFRTARRAPR